MRVWLDCEFNGWNGELISMALVSADGREFYEVVGWGIKPVPWVAEHVMPYLGKPAIQQAEFTQKLQEFLCSLRSPTTIIADWPDDISYFCKALITGPGECIQTPPLTLSIQKMPPEAYESEVPHNALSDARAMRLATMMVPGAI